MYYFSTSGCYEEENFESIIDDQKYKITIKFSQAIKKYEREFGEFMNCFVNDLFVTLGMRQRRRENYDTSGDDELKISKNSDHGWILIISWSAWHIYSFHSWCLI